MPVSKKANKSTPAAKAVVAASTTAPASAAGRKARPAVGKPAGKPSRAAKSRVMPASGKPARRASAPVETKAAAGTTSTEPAGATKVAKAHKPKLVRDSFTIPKDEYQVLDALKSRALGLEQHVRKSELLRAGIRALSAMNDRAFLAAIDAVPTLKTGRPKKG